MRKYTYIEVFNIFKNSIYELITSEYTNVVTKLVFKDKDEYYYSQTLNKFIHNQIPPKFHISNIFTLQNIKLYLQINFPEHELLTDKYISNTCEILLKDKEGYLYSTTLARLLHSTILHKVHYSNEFSLDNINNFLKISNTTLIVLNTSYEKNLNLIDSDGYLYTTSWNKLQSGRLPMFVHSLNIHSHSNIKIWLVKNNKKFELIDNIYIDSIKKLKFKCLKCNEFFYSAWRDIKDECGCPYCSGHQAGLSNCLATLNPELSKEWHPVKNGVLTPFDVITGTSKKVWWICSECSHEWPSTVKNRHDKNSGCPECSKSKGEKRISKNFMLKNILFMPQKEFEGLVGINNGSLSYDFYLKQYNLLIEYQGEMHERFCKGIHKTKKDFEKQVEHDRRKKEYALKNNINFLEIWYWDFNKIESILDGYLNSLKDVLSIA